MISIKLPWPPTVNTYYTVARGRKILSKRGRKYKDDCAAEMLLQRPGKVAGRLGIRIDAFVPDRRKRDLDNLVKPVLDSLGSGPNALFDDDSQIDQLAVYRCPVAKPGFLRVYVRGLRDNPSLAILKDREDALEVG